MLNASTVRPPGLYAHCSASFNEHLVVFGGRTFNLSVQHLQQNGDTWSFDLRRWHWTLLVGSSTLDHPGPRENHACVLQRHSDEEADLLVVGGLLSSQLGEAQTSTTATANQQQRSRRHPQPLAHNHSLFINTPMVARSRLQCPNSHQ